jgi:hypothetical protein
VLLKLDRISLLAIANESNKTTPIGPRSKPAALPAPLETFAMPEQPKPTKHQKPSHNVNANNSARKENKLLSDI